MPETYYDRLGVAPDASAATIRRAYRECLKEAHPDVSDDPDAAARTRRLVEAKAVLTDDAERRRYDRLGHERYVTRHGDGPATVDERAATGDQDPERSPGEDADGPSGPGDFPGDASDGVAETGTDDHDRATDDGHTSTASATSRAGTVTDKREARHRQNRETRADWNTTGSDREGSASGQGSRHWRAWDTDAPYRVHAADQTTLGSRLFPPGPSLILLAVGFAIYPVVLWAAITPAFPLVINLVVAACLLGLVAFLVGMPAVGVTVFGTWTVLLPTILTVGFGVPLLSLPWLIALAGTALPLGLSVLIYVALRG